MRVLTKQSKEQFMKVMLANEELKTKRKAAKEWQEKMDEQGMYAERAMRIYKKSGIVI